MPGALTHNEWPNSYLWLDVERNWLTMKMLRR